MREQRRWEQPTYRHASPRFTDAMKRIDAAPVWELRAFTRFVADVLWGLGDGTSRARPRRLEMEKEWDCAGILSDVSFDIRRRSFNPFPVSGGGVRRRARIPRDGRTQRSIAMRALGPGAAGAVNLEHIIQLHIEKLPEGAYLATSDDVQGLVAQGDTIDEAIEIARDLAGKLLEAQAAAPGPHHRYQVRAVASREWRAGRGLVVFPLCTKGQRHS